MQYYWLIAQGLLLAVLRVSKWWWGSSPGVLCAKHVLSHVSFLVYFWAIVSGAQGLIMALCSAITPLVCQ